MENNFFDEKILQSAKPEYQIVENHKDLQYHFIKDGFSLQFFCKIGSERLNPSEIKALLNYNKEKKFLSKSDVALLNYVVHRLVGIQTVYKILGDFDLFASYLAETNFPLYFNYKKADFSKESLTLNFTLDFENESDIVLNLENEGIFIFGQDNSYFVTEDKIYNLSSKLPLKFYREIEQKNNRFSIDTFFNLKDNLIKTVKAAHNLKLGSEVEKLNSLEIEERVATKILEVGKTNHFIVIQLKYRIGDELFEVNDYTYLETISWVDKKHLIKIVREEGKLVKYVSDEKISEFLFDDLFMGSRIRFNKSSKSPFLLMLPIAYLEKFSKEILPTLEKHFKIEYPNGSITVLKRDINFEIETDLKSKLNLFEFKVKFKIGGEYFDLDFLKDLMQKSKKLVTLEDGTTVDVENVKEISRWIEFLNKFEFKKKDGAYKTESATALELDEFLHNFKSTHVKSNEEYRNLLLELKEKNPINKIELPSSVEPILRDYQKEGVYWLHFLKKYGFGGILADEMGLGKTIQALTILAMNSGMPHIVVCPKTLIYNWENEIRRFFPKMRVLVVDGDIDTRKQQIRRVNNYDVVITSYTILQKDYSEYVHQKLHFKYMILDEAHYVKNMKTLSAKAVRIISAENKILLTGTPLENNLDELYSAFDLIMPDYLGSRTNFGREFGAKIERNNQIALELLQAKIRPFILRRTKKEVLKELPDKQEQVVYSEMTNKQTAIYNELLQRVRSEVNELVEKQGFDKSRIQVLSALLKLRQICNHPSLVDDSFVGEQDISGKYNMFSELLQEVIESEEKVLVFSQFTSMLDIFEKDLIEQKIKFVRLDGSTKNRQELVDEFNMNPEIKVFLISLKAGGVGLNLTSASAVFLYDPWWNPMVEKQAMDRAHRIGQKNTVNIYKFITRNSIEEKILKLQERKGNLFDNLVSDNAGFMKRLEWEDLMELFE